MSGTYIKYPPKSSGGSGGGGLTGSVSLTNQVSGILPIANGGTNSGTTLNNLRFVISSGGAIVEAAALTANAPMRTDANGLPTIGSTNLTSEVMGNLPLSQTSGSISLTNQVSGSLPLSQTSGSLSLSSLAGAIAINTIANNDFAQIWNWDTIGSGVGLTLATAHTGFIGSVLKLSSTGNNAAAVGSLLQITSTGTANKVTGISLTNASTDAASIGLNVSMNGAGSQANNGILVSNVSTGGAAIAASRSGTGGTSNLVTITDASTNNSTGLYINMSGSTGQQGAFTADVQANGTVVVANFRAKGTSNTGTVMNISNASTTGGSALDADISNTGAYAIFRLHSFATATNGNGPAILFRSYRTGPTTTDIAQVAGIITDITAGAYKGALVFSTANNAIPAERLRITNTGASLFTTSLTVPTATIGSISHTSSTGGAAYTVTWPGAQGTSGQTISNDGSGNLSWAASSGLTNPMTTSGDIIIGSGGGAAVRLALGSGSFSLVSNPALSPPMQYENITSPDELRNVKLKAIGDGAGGITVTLLSSQADGDPGTPPSPTNPLRIAVRNPNISSTVTRYHLVTITASMSCSIAQSSNGGVLASSGGYYWVYLIANPTLPFPGAAYSLGIAAAKLDEGKLQSSFVDAQGINIGNGSTSWQVPIATNIQAGMRFSLTSGGVVQSGFSVGVSYYVVSPTATGFGLSATSGGESITAGSGGSQMAMHWQSPHLTTCSAAFSQQPVRLIGRITPTYPAIIGSMTAPVDIVCGGTLLPPSPRVTTQIFVTGSGTYYLPPTCQAIKVTIIGGGGGGGGTASGAASGGAGSGGGGGGAAVKYIMNPGSAPGAASSTSFTFTVGPGGAGGTAGNNAGSTGSSSLFGTVLLAGFGGVGGAGGAAAAIAITGNGGGGGNAQGGDLNIPGSGGLFGLVIAAGSAAGGAGGGTLLAGATMDNLNSNSPGAAGNLYGGGGAGGDNINNGGQQAGGAGANGIVLIEEFY